MRAQRGFAMIAIVTMVALMAAYLVANALTSTQASVASAKEMRTQLALREAKRALIAWAASEALQQDESSKHFQPGALPCPAMDDPATPNQDGNAEGLCPNASTRFGRLPWKTLGVADLRDASGERLWYAVSSDFRKTTTTTVINSDTDSGAGASWVSGRTYAVGEVACSLLDYHPYRRTVAGAGTTDPASDTANWLRLNTLSVIGTSPACSVVAVILSPGVALQQNANVKGAVQNQLRDPTSVTAIRDPRNYFEGENAGSNDVFEVASVTSDIANDRLVVITAAELMDAVELNVAALVHTRGLSTGATKTIRDFINDYVADWGKYPYPVPFTNPSTSDFKGVAVSPGSGPLEGFLPMTADTTFVVWQNPTGTTITQVSGTSLFFTAPNCTASSSRLISCTFTYLDFTGPVIEISTTVLNAGRAFVNKNTSADISLMSNGLADKLQSKSVGCSALVSPLANESYCLQTTNTLLANGNATVVLRMQLKPHVWSAEVLQINVPPFSELVAPANYHPNATQPTSTPPDSNAWWFYWNQWYKQVYYAVSPAYLPSTCTANCGLLTVHGLASGTTTNARAVLILAGRSINGAPRPSSSLASYLEGENLTSGNAIYESRLGALLPATSPAIAVNDRAIVLGP